MILHALQEGLVKKQLRGSYLYPDYDKYCLSNIPTTILALFGVKTLRPTLPKKLYAKAKSKKTTKIVLFLLDGLGYDTLLAYGKNYHFFKHIMQKGSVAPITTIFPSTTSAAITSINTGLTPQEHALPEWNVYFKELDMILHTLPFKPVDPKFNEELVKSKFGPEILFDGRTVYQILKKEGIKSFVLSPADTANSAYSKLVYKGSTMIPYLSASDLVVNLRELLEKTKGPTYVYVYWAGLDSVEHKYGPHTGQQLAELSILGYALQKEFVNKIKKKIAEETTLLVTSDHGQLNVKPKNTIYLNKFSKLVKNLRRGKKGRPILPSGSPRDVFLHIKQDKLSETIIFLRTRLRDKADILETRTALAQGLFGIGEPSKKFLDRIGDLLIIPHEKRTIWYEHVRGHKFDLDGMHGGFSPSEILIPFVSVRLSDLKN